MSNIGELWDALRRASLERLAPDLIRHGVVSINQLVLQYDTLHGAGVPHWQLEAILAASESPAAGPVTSPGQAHRDDLPVRNMGKRACLQAALEAALTQSETEVPADVGPRRPRQVNKPGRGGQSQDLHGHLPCLGGGGFPFGQPEHQVFRGLLESGRVSQCRGIFSGHLWASAKGSQDTNSRHSQDGHP